MKAYLAGKRLNANDYAGSDSDVRHFGSRPLQESLETQRALRRETIFAFLRSAVTQKDLAPRAGSILSISTGSVDTNIKFLPPAFLGLPFLGLPSEIFTP